MDERVGGPDDFEQRGARLRILEVEAERTLVAVDVQVSWSHARRATRLADVTHGVALGRLDLDHVGTLIGEQHRAVGTQDHVGQIDDADAVQRPGHDLSFESLQRFVINALPLRPP
jgi:hypothetical protein